MRITVRDWQRDWIRDNGKTDEMEVILVDRNDNELYCGSFIGIPEKLLERTVAEHGVILSSTDPARNGLFNLKISER